MSGQSVNEPADQGRLEPELERLNGRLHYNNYPRVYQKPKLFKRLRVGQKGPTWIILGPQGAGKSLFSSSILRTSFGKDSTREWNLFRSLDKQKTVTKLTTTFEAEICDSKHQFIDVIGIKDHKDLKALRKIFEEEYLDQVDIDEWADEGKDKAVAIDQNLQNIAIAADQIAPEAEIYFDGVIMILPANLDADSKPMKASIDLIRTLGEITYPYPIVVVITFANSHPQGVQPIKDRVKDIVDDIYEIENYAKNSEWSDSQDIILRSVVNSLVHQSHKLNNSVIEDTWYNRFVMCLGMFAFKFKREKRRLAALGQYSSFSALGLILLILNIIVALFCF